MIVYNVTTKVDKRVAADWLLWMGQEHIPDIIATGLFTHAHILRLLDVDDSEGPTYAVQYYSPGKEAYHQYIDAHADGMRKKAIDRWGESVISFRSVLELVN